MATITKHVDGTQPHQVMQGEVGFYDQIIDFSVDNASSGDVVQGLKVKAGTIILDCGVLVLANELGVTADLGDTTEPNGYIEAITLNSTGVYRSESTDAYGAGRYYSADDTIDLTLDNDLSAAKVMVWAIYSTPSLA